MHSGNLKKGAMNMKDGLTAEDLRWLHSLDLAISICTRMEELGLSKNEVAERAGMKASALSRIIAGEQHLTLSTIAKLECALDMRFDAGFRYETKWEGLSYSAPQGQVNNSISKQSADARFSSKRMEERSETFADQATDKDLPMMGVAA